jgi:hypothetical protein
LIYFLCHPDPGNYQWDIIPLAEGLEALDIPCCSNADYWIKPDGNHLLKRSRVVDPLSCDAIVVSTGFLNWVKDDGKFESGALPGWLLTRGSGSRARVIGLDISDGYLSPVTTRWAQCFDVILRAQYNRRMWWPANVRPWAFGLTNRIMDAAGVSMKPWNERASCVFAFGASHGFVHGAREWATKRIRPQIAETLGITSSEDDLNLPPDNPGDALLWRQCVRRHSPAFFERLGSAKACAAFCGELIPGLPRKVDFLVGGNRAKLRRCLRQTFSTMLGLMPRNVQPDSWRFWEAIACGTAVIHFDMSQSGWELPAMPENWRHYIGVDLRRPKEAISRLRDDSSVLERVAQEGHKWAIEHYSPKAVALRFLHLAGLDNRAAASA